jgi:hypothetical protein
MTAERGNETFNQSVHLIRRDVNMRRPILRPNRHPGVPGIGFHKQGHCDCQAGERRKET